MVGGIVPRGEGVPLYGHEGVRGESRSASRSLIPIAQRRAKSTVVVITINGRTLQILTYKPPDCARVEGFTVLLLSE